MNQNLQNIIEPELDDDSRPNLADVWQVLDTPIYRVVDKEGVNVAGGCVRRLSSGAAGYWLYVDDTDGYQILDDVSDLYCVQDEKHIAYGWDRDGNVVKM